MATSNFGRSWSEAYNLTPPIPHLFKRVYPKRWLRVHSLPKAKRYPENETEWAILLERQKSIIIDLLSEDQCLFLVIGQYFHRGNPLPFFPEPSLSDLSFTKLSAFRLEVFDENDQDLMYQPFFASTDRAFLINDKLLKDIANDEFRVFLVSFERCLLIAPYDGGVDIIFKDEITKEHYKTQYKDWLSNRADGL